VLQASERIKLWRIADPNDRPLRYAFASDVLEQRDEPVGSYRCGIC
jgi:hypothetical protein